MVYLNSMFDILLVIEMDFLNLKLIVFVNLFKVWDNFKLNVFFFCFFFGDFCFGLIGWGVGKKLVLGLLLIVLGVGNKGFIDLVVLFLMILIGIVFLIVVKLVLVCWILVVWIFCFSKFVNLFNLFLSDLLIFLLILLLILIVLVINLELVVVLFIAFFILLIVLIILFDFFLIVWVINLEVVWVLFNFVDMLLSLDKVLEVDLVVFCVGLLFEIIFLCIVCIFCGFFI